MGTCHLCFVFLKNYFNWYKKSEIHQKSKIIRKWFCKISTLWFLLRVKTKTKIIIFGTNLSMYWRLLKLRKKDLTCPYSLSFKLIIKFWLEISSSFWKTTILVVLNKFEMQLMCFEIILHLWWAWFWKHRISIVWNMWRLVSF